MFFLRGALAAIDTTSDELLISAYKVVREEYSGPGRIIDQIQLLNKEVNALSNEIESRAKVVLKHQRKMQDLKKKVKGVQDLEERKWNEFINWSVRFDLKQEATSLDKELNQQSMSKDKMAKVREERWRKTHLLLRVSIVLL